MYARAGSIRPAGATRPARMQAGVMAVVHSMAADVTMRDSRVLHVDSRVYCHGDTRKACSTCSGCRQYKDVGLSRVYCHRECMQYRQHKEVQTMGADGGMRTAGYLYSSTKRYT